MCRNYRFLSQSVLLFALFLLAGLCIPQPASGSLVVAYFAENLYTSTVERTVNDGANWYTTTVGLFRFQRGGGDYPGFSAIDFYAFCIEPREFVSVGTTYTYDWSVLEDGATNIGGMGIAKATLLSELYAQYYPSFLPVLNQDKAGALQIATWEIVRETSGTMNVLEGTTRFRNAANPTTMTLAQSYLDSLTGAGPYMDVVAALTAVGGVQDVVVHDNPEPGTLALLGLGLLALAAAGKVRKR